MRPFVPLRPGSRFRAVYRTGRRRRSGGVTVFRGAGNSSMPEVGVVAGRGVGNAVQRNRAKRRLREAALRSDLQPNTAYVLVASRNVVDVRFDELMEWLADGIGRERAPMGSEDRK